MVSAFFFFFITVGRLKGGELKAEWRGTLGLVERHGGEVLGFSFCLVHSRLTAEGSNLEKLLGAEKKKNAPTKAWLNQRTRKGAA